MAKRVQNTKKNTLSYAEIPTRPTFDWESFGWIAIPALLMLVVSATSVMDITLMPKYLAFIAFLFMAIMAFWGGKKKNYIEYLLKNNSILWAYLLFLGLSSVALLNAHLFGDAFLNWSKTGLGLIFLILWVNYFIQTDNLRENITLTIALFSIISGLVGLSQAAKLMEESEITHENLYKITSLFSHKNIFAEVILLCLPFNFFGIFYYKMQITKYLSLVAFIFSLSISIGLLSRSIWVALIIASFLTFCLYAWRERKSEGRNILKYLGIGVGTLFISFLIMGFIISFETLIKQFNGIMSVRHIANVERLEQWRNTLTLFSQKPFFGIGWENWKIEIMQFPAAKGTKSEFGDYFFQRPHNDFLWVLCETGIFSFMAYISIFVAAYIHIFQSLKVADNKEVKMWLYLLFAALTAYSVFSNFSFPKERIEEVFLFNLILVAILVEKVKHTKIPLVENTHAIYPKIQLATALLFLSASLYIGYTHFEGETHIRNYTTLADLAKVQNGNEKINSTRKSIQEVTLAYRPLFQMDGVSTPLLYHRGTQYLKLNEVEAGLKDLIAAQKLSPNHPQVLNNLAAAYSMKGDMKNAAKYISKVIELTPKYEDALLSSIVMYALEKDFDKAFEKMTQIDTASKNAKYLFFNKAIRDSVALYATKNLEEPFLKSKVYGIMQDKNWSKAILQKAKAQNYPFSGMLKAEAIEMMRKDKNLSDAEWVMLRDKYFSDSKKGK